MPGRAGFDTDSIARPSPLPRPLPVRAGSTSGLESIAGERERGSAGKRVPRGRGLPEV